MGSSQNHECKVRYKLRWRLDDYLFVLAWISLLFPNTVFMVATSYGFGGHMSKVPFAHQDSFPRLMTVSQCLTRLNVALSKTAVAITLYRFASKRWQKRLVIGPAFLVDFLMVLSAISIFAACRYWFGSSETNNLGANICWDPQLLIGFVILVGVLSAATDFIFAFLAWPMVWGLQLDTKTKFGLAMGMSLGVFSGITSAYKVRYVASMVNFTDEYADYIIWTSAEIAVIIMAAAIPFFRPAIIEISGKVAAWRQSRRRANLCIEQGILLTNEVTVRWDTEPERCREMEAGLKYGWSVSISSPALPAYERQISTVR
ncbi:hypothetical protein B0H67DRAFT_3569 [Lasiosphaeris hirsuta]|uniref:Rhodopsin domain-containing protein n=1 Tax=Lasiosphaeris hirsuta TaxID=260670 RepID=A0AA40EA26_9PEZI|nr:hypothetical protein B0H67DRAFT_3569 [Lasiosphaeris hirsuta]